MFISYSSEDLKVAKAVVKCLETNNISCWIAYRDAEVGIEFASSIIDAIKRCRVALCIVSKNFNASKHCLREVDAACKYEKMVVPFRIDECRLNNALEYYLSTTHWLNAWTPPVDSHFKDMVVAVNKHLGRAEKPAKTIDKQIKKEIKQQKKEIKKQKKEIDKLKKSKLVIKKR